MPKKKTKRDEKELDAYQIELSSERKKEIDNWTQAELEKLKTEKVTEETLKEDIANIERNDVIKEKKKSKEKKEKKEPYYKLDNILAFDADYNMIYGERSNGKTTAVLNYGLDEHIDSGYINQTAIIRRWDEDFKGKNGQQMYEGIVALGWIKEKTKGKYNSVYYYSQRWYLCLYDENGNKKAQEDEPFAIGFSINSEEHYKSTSYPNVTTILFDEFITREYYLPEEFVKFQNLLSTIIRLRTNVKIFMCGNTINKFCPYFAEMGLSGIKKQLKGTIDLYTYGESGLRVAVEYSDFPSKKKASNKYFAFDNPKLEMITQGGWEIDIYPHLPQKYAPKNVIYVFYIIFDNEMLQGNVVSIDDKVFLYLHRKTTPIKEDNTNLVYKQEPDYHRHCRINILKPYAIADTKIAGLIAHKKVFYQNNEIGEIFNNYLKWCEVNA